MLLCICISNFNKTVCGVELWTTAMWSCTDLFFSFFFFRAVRAVIGVIDKNSSWFHAQHLILHPSCIYFVYNLIITKYLLYILWINRVSELYCFFILECTFKTYAKQSLGGSGINILSSWGASDDVDDTDHVQLPSEGEVKVHFLRAQSQSAHPFSVPQDVLSPGALGTASVSHFQFTTGKGGIWVVVLQPIFVFSFSVLCWW